MKWPPSISELYGNEWDQRCKEFTNLVTAIVQDISLSARRGDIFRKATEPEIRQRADRLVAFGQFAESASATSEHLANAGLFGTSAAIESMVLCIESSDFDQSRKIRLRSEVIQAWNFVDVAAGLARSDPKSKYYWQLRCTLRACHVLRAAAATKRLLPYLGQSPIGIPDTTSPAESALVADFQASFDQAIAACANTITEACVPDEESLVGLPDWMWRFGVEDTGEALGTVRSLDQAVYLVSSVLVAVVHARSAGVIDDETARQLFPSERRDWLIEASLNSDRLGALDPRFGLFGLWALSHLDDRNRDLHPLSLGISDSPRTYALPEHLAFGPAFDGRRFSERVERTLAAVLEDPSGLVEVQSDYRMVIGMYRRDYFAVPVVPTVVMLAARYRPRWLFRRSLGQVFDQVLGAVSANSCDDIPYQLSAGANGVVFTSYLLAAGCAARSALSQMKKLRRIWEWAPAVTYQDNFSGVVVAVLLVILGGPGAYLVVHRHDTALGVWIGAWIGLVFSVLVVPLNDKLWVRRP